MYKLQKYRGKKVTRKKDSRLSLSRKSCRRRCRVKTKRCHIRSYTRRFRKYTIKRGNKRVRKNTQRGGKRWWENNDEEQSASALAAETAALLDLAEAEKELKKDAAAEAAEAEKLKNITDALEIYIRKQYPELGNNTELTFLTFAKGQVTKVRKADSLKSARFSGVNRIEDLYIFVSKPNNIFYIVRCAEKKGCPARFTTFSKLTDSGVEVGSLYHNIAEGISRPLEGMESKVLRLELHSNENGVSKGYMYFKGVGKETYYLIIFSGDDLNRITDNEIPDVQTGYEWWDIATAEAKAVAEAKAAAEIQVGDLVTIKDAKTFNMYKVMKVSNDERGNTICYILKEDGILYPMPINDLERFYTTAK